MLARALTSKVNWILDNLVPPMLRDSRWFMKIWFRLLFRDRDRYFMEFKDNAPFLGKREFSEYYTFLEGSHIQRESDLTSREAELVIASVRGDSVLDVGCGRGYLSRRIALAKNIAVTGIDINIPARLVASSLPPGLSFLAGDIESLPFPTGAFDTVVCAHTLEHVQDIQQAVRELRRVARRRILIVVPRQREYRYTFDLHLHFFPYPFSLQRVMKNNTAHCSVIDNDLFYQEECGGPKIG